MKLERLALGVLLGAGVVGVGACSGCRQSDVEVAEVDFEQHGFDFDEIEVVIGVALRPTVLTGFLLGGDFAELVVVDVDEDDERRLRIYTFDAGTWAPKLDATLGSDVLFVDVVDIDGADRLVTYAPGRLSWFDPQSASERELVAVTSDFDPPRSEEIPHVDVSQDVNGDDRDDLVVPDVDGFHVFVQMEGGVFADPVKIGPDSDLSRIYGADGYRYEPWSQSRVHAVDYDHDGRDDLVFWNEDHFEVHIQDERGLFAVEAETFTTEVPFDSDDLSFLATGNMTGRVLHSLADLNGDGVGDLVIHTLKGRRISKKRSTYEVHFGARSPLGGTVFATAPGATFQTEDRIQLGMERHDFDGDGQVDLMLTTIDVRFLKGSLWKSLKGFMGDDVRLELEFYRMEGGRLPDEPSTTRRTALDGVPSHREPGSVPLEFVLRGGTHENRKTERRWPRAFNTTLLIGDVTGDGRSDLLMSSHPRIIEVHIGVPGRDLFTRRSQSLRIPPPNDEEYTWLVDLNEDGKQDVLMHHPFTLRDGHGGRQRPPGTEPHRVTMLIAR